MMGSGYIKLVVRFGGTGLVICSLNRWSRKSKDLSEAEWKKMKVTDLVSAKPECTSDTAWITGMETLKPYCNTDTGSIR